jgi:maltooligosyltrehalose trehalohydrolase
MDVHILFPDERIIPLQNDHEEYFAALVHDIQPGARYKYRLNGEAEFPDPASRFQPEGVHGPSEVRDISFEWTDSCWFGIPLKDYIFYEIHVGAFTPEGTFEAIIPLLDYLADLGVTAIELMPVSQFPGWRNWGYDGTYPFAAQTTYGGPRGLQQLVDACHSKGLAIALDVVYNHFGPEGNYITNFGPYFTARHKTPWGDAVNFDDAYSDGVRRFFLENATYWLKEFHIDALRIDAVHAILDFSARPFLEELAIIVRRLSEKLNRRLHLIPESDLNDPRLIQAPELGGFGLDAQWCDDFHHSLRTLLTPDHMGYYQDFGRLTHLAKAFREGYVYSGQYSRYRGRRHGGSSRGIPRKRFVVYSQNHDQVGNRAQGERLSELAPFPALKLAAAIVILSPFLPLLFMGEEYAETARFPYFFSHGDSSLIEAVRQGRREEFLEFAWEGEPPDPHSEATFQRAKLHHSLKTEAHHKVLLNFYKDLIRLRKSVPGLACIDTQSLVVDPFEPERALLVRRCEQKREIVCFFHCKDTSDEIDFLLPEGQWIKLLDSNEERWNGDGNVLPETLQSSGRVKLKLPPFGAAVFMNKGET